MMSCSVSENVACVFRQHGKPPVKKHWSVSEKKKSCSSWSAAADDDAKFTNVHKSRPQSSDSLLWVDNHKPTNLREIIGQQGDKSSARKLYVWLSNWRDNFWKKPVCMFHLPAQFVTESRLVLLIFLPESKRRTLCVDCCELWCV